MDNLKWIVSSQEKENLQSNLVKSLSMGLVNLLNAVGIKLLFSGLPKK
jgi:hypothetical protein